MADPKKQDSIPNGEIGDSDRADQSSSGGLQDSSSSAIGSGANSRVLRENDEIGLTERLTDILVNEGDGDLLIQQDDREDRLLQWLQALDLQVMGACRADERLKPLLKLNVSGGAAEDRLLAHLNQHFEASEVGVLARCLCIPLVSIRVGKIAKQGTLLCPTTTRGTLNLALLPTSDLRISFVGDDGSTERLATLHSIGQRSAVAIEEISEDSSSRSFFLKISDSQVFYFWCSEKSKLLGNELLAKMKDLLRRTPSLADLTGICEARLSCFATHLRTYLIGSTVNNRRSSSTAVSPDMMHDRFGLDENAEIASATSKFSRSRHAGSQAIRANSPHQNSLSARSSSFKEGLLRNSSLRTTAREKFRRHGHLSSVENLPLFATIATDGSSACDSGKDRAAENAGSRPLSSFLESIGNSTIPPFVNSGSQGPPIGSSLFSPYYCLCPPQVSSLQYKVTHPQQQLSSESLSLPPLSSFLPSTGPSDLLTPGAPLSLSLTSTDFPAFFPEPLVRLPLSSPSSQEIPTFTPLMCDPIVHVPVIDICSSGGQGYLVSAGSAISTAIPPLHTNIVRSLGGPQADSVVEKGARETLRLLISSGSNQTSPQLMDVLPAVLTSSGENLGVLVTGSRGLYNGSQDVSALANGVASMGLATGSRGLYNGSQDVGALPNGMASFGLVSLSGLGESLLKRCSSREELENPSGRPDGPVASSSSDDHGFIFSKSSNEGTDLN